VRRALWAASSEHQIHPANRVVHIFGPDAHTHHLTVPIGCTLIEWRDPSVLEPPPRLPPYGPGAFRQMGDELQRMTEEMGRTFGKT